MPSPARRAIAKSGRHSGLRSCRTRLSQNRTCPSQAVLAKKADAVPGRLLSSACAGVQGQGLCLAVLLAAQLPRTGHQMHPVRVAISLMCGCGVAAGFLFAPGVRAVLLPPPAFAALQNAACNYWVSTSKTPTAACGSLCTRQCVLTVGGRLPSRVTKVPGSHCRSVMGARCECSSEDWYAGARVSGTLLASAPVLLSAAAAAAFSCSSCFLSSALYLHSSPVWHRIPFA